MSFPKLQALVVEDEETHRTALIDALNESLEIEVAGMATSVSEAFDLVKNTPADVLFLDIVLIGGDAFQLINLLKRQQVPVPPIVIQTGRGKFEHGERILNEFRDDVLSILQKPFYENWEKKRDSIIDAIYVKNQTLRLASQKPTEMALVKIEDGRKNYFVNPKDIIMVKTGPKGKGKTIVVFEKFEMPCSLSLSQLLPTLPKAFIQINRYEAININWISILDHSDKEVKLRNGESSLIGTAYYSGLCEWVERG